MESAKCLNVFPGRQHRGPRTEIGGALEFCEAL